MRKQKRRISVKYGSAVVGEFSATLNLHENGTYSAVYNGKRYPVENPLDPFIRL